MYFQHIAIRIVNGDQIALHVRDSRRLNGKSLDYWISLHFFIKIGCLLLLQLQDLAVLFYTVIISWVIAGSVESLLGWKHNSEHLKVNEMFVLSVSDEKDPLSAVSTPSCISHAACIAPHAWLLLLWVSVISLQCRVTAKSVSLLFCCTNTHRFLLLFIVGSAVFSSLPMEGWQFPKAKEVCRDWRQMKNLLLKSRALVEPQKSSLVFTFHGCLINT